jgi:prepilin-type N-terminal cleavage/methylation domain-containing protein
MKNNQGFTLIELMVSLGLFAILSTIVISSFINFSNIQAKTSVMKDNQQKIRTALDQMIKQIKEAKTVVIDESDPSEKVIDLTYTEAPGAAARYKITSDGGLWYSECNISAVTELYQACTSIDDIDPQNLLADSSAVGNMASSVILDFAESSMCWNSPKNSPDACSDKDMSGNSIPVDDRNNSLPSVKVKLSGYMKFSSNTFYQDEFYLETLIPLGDRK